LRQVLGLSLFGLLLGVPAAWVAGPLVGSLLYGVAPGDVLTIGLASVLLVLVSLGAGYRPARRASQVDPLVALRTE
jgi:ABC-type antimicrobial peptide transport system permease subunit